MLPKCDVKMYKVKMLKLQSLPSAIYKVQSALYKVKCKKKKWKEKMQKVQIYKVKMYTVKMQKSENVQSANAHHLVISALDVRPR